MLKLLAVLISLALCAYTQPECTTEELLFSDEFDFLDLGKWKHDNTLAGGGNWEFQWYTNNRSNSFVQDGILHIKPTLTSDQLGEKALSDYTLDLNGATEVDSCTNPAFYGCVRTGNENNILNPVKSALLRSRESFSFPYGRVEIRAKMPVGDWLWPAIWLLPRYNTYGGWPASGEIDIVESRGNLNYTLNGEKIGVQQVGSTLHWGPYREKNMFEKTHWQQKNEAGYHSDFFLYELVWTTDYIAFKVNKKEIGRLAPPEGGFWQLGDFGDKTANPWRGGSKMAPFDQEFYIIINLAVGGIADFPDAGEAEQRANRKPWGNTSPRASTDFWNGRNYWLPTWELDKNNNAALQVDYVRVYTHVKCAYSG